MTYALKTDENDKFSRFRAQWLQLLLRVLNRRILNNTTSRAPIRKEYLICCSESALLFLPTPDPRADLSL